MPRRARGGRLRAWLLPAWMTRDVRLLLAARAFMSATRALASVIVPIYLARLGYSAVQLGILFAVAGLTSAVLSALSGLLADRLGRKPFLVAIPLFTALAGLVFALSSADALLFIFAALGSFGRGSGAGGGTVGPYQPAEQALLADLVPARVRNALFGRAAFAASLGALIGGGPLAALPDLLAHTGLRGLATYRPAFLILAALALVAGLLALPLANPRPARAPAQESPRRRWRPRLSRRSWTILLKLCATNSVGGLSTGFFGPFVTYWFYRRFGAGPGMVALLYAAINVAAMLSNLGAAGIARRLGLVRAIVLSRTLQAALVIPMVLAPTFWGAGAFYLLRMLAQRVAIPLRQSYVMAVVPPEERSSVAALSSLPSQVASGSAPALAGYLFAHVGLAVPFELSAGLRGLNTLLFFMFFRHLAPPEEREARERSRTDAA